MRRREVAWILSFDAGSGPGHRGLSYHGFLERGFGREFSGIMVEPDGVWEFSPDDPTGTEYVGCDVAAR